MRCCDLCINPALLNSEFTLSIYRHSVRGDPARRLQVRGARRGHSALSSAHSRLLPVVRAREARGVHGRKVRQVHDQRGHGQETEIQVGQLCLR
jgi:hypothetical protein